MSITKEWELLGMQEVSKVVAVTLKKMQEYDQPGMTTKELDEYGGELLQFFGARSAHVRDFRIRISKKLRYLFSVGKGYEGQPTKTHMEWFRG